MKKGFFSSRAHILKRVFTKPAYIAIAVAAFIAYNLFYNYLIKLSSYEIFITTVPMYMVDTLIATSAILLSLSVFGIMQSRRRRKSISKSAIPSSAISVAMPSVGGLVASCGCETPILGSILYPLGLNFIAVGNVISFISRYNFTLLGIFIAINIMLIFYQSGKMPKTII